ncbi:flagellar FlbD family protein [Cellulomonas sp. Root137]|uniref:flagellar FlbD family protein n=1 Tax=Cellulomonas sp. Root137 TaxID=1736459 RepID=UPI001F19B248|nr:flagellar FlbD family protein [Cellulomonas sp. Root137]
MTRLAGGQFGVNPDLIQRIDSAPDTILTLIDGTKYIVAESMPEVIDRIQEQRAQILARAQEIQVQPRMELVPDLPSEPDDTDEPAPGGTFTPPVPFRPRSG